MLAYKWRKTQTRKMDGERERESELDELDDYAKNTKLFLKTHFQLCVLLLFY